MNVNERIVDHENRIERLEDHYNKHAEILFNEGRGIAFRIDRIEQARKNNRNTLPVVISIISTLIAIASLLVMVLK